MPSVDLPVRLATRFAMTLKDGLQDRRDTLFLLGPVLGLTAWIGSGPIAGLAIGLGLPLLALLLSMPGRRPPTRDGLVRRLDSQLTAARNGAQTAVLMIGIDGFARLKDQHDHATIESLLQTCAERLTAVLRDGDRVMRLEGAAFAVALTPARRIDLEAAIQLAGRLQRALGTPLALGGGNLYLTASVGFALAARLVAPTGETLLRAAQLAMSEAARCGPGTIRSYSRALEARVTSRCDLAREIGEALQRGEVTAFFQPQISTRTGAVTGCEALARWHHPERGLIPPSEFLPALKQAGLIGRLGLHMVTEALAALRAWDEAGLCLPRVGVNFSTEELVDPRLVDRIAFEIDRFGLTPDRLGIEVLETVVADTSDDMVVRNLAALARLGCRLDLDDFGTGHASITTIRRFVIGRIKIDRSFVTRIDADPEQQNMVAAILTMAERLGLDTLAEGVETPEEQTMLARLGCGHVQGFGIARPMPLEEATAWLTAARSRTSGPLPLRRQSG